MSKTRAAYHRKKIRLVRGPTPEFVEANRNPANRKGLSNVPMPVMGWWRRWFGVR